MTGTPRNTDEEIHFILHLHRQGVNKADIASQCDANFKNRIRTAASVKYVIGKYKDDKDYLQAATPAVLATNFSGPLSAPHDFVQGGHSGGNSQNPPSHGRSFIGNRQQQQQGSYPGGHAQNPIYGRSLIGASRQLGSYAEGQSPNLNNNGRSFIDNRQQESSYSRGPAQSPNQGRMGTPQQLGNYPGGQSPSPNHGRSSMNDRPHQSNYPPGPARNTIHRQGFLNGQSQICLSSQEVPDDGLPPLPECTQIRRQQDFPRAPTNGALSKQSLHQRSMPPFFNQQPGDMMSAFRQTSNLGQGLADNTAPVPDHQTQQSTVLTTPNTGVINGHPGYHTGTPALSTQNRGGVMSTSSHVSNNQVLVGPTSFPPSSEYKLSQSKGLGLLKHFTLWKLSTCGRDVQCEINSYFKKQIQLDGWHLISGTGQGTEIPNNAIIREYYFTPTSDGEQPYPVQIYGSPLSETYHPIKKRNRKARAATIGPEPRHGVSASQDAKKKNPNDSYDFGSANAARKAREIILVKEAKAKVDKRYALKREEYEKQPEVIKSKALAKAYKEQREAERAEEYVWKPLSDKQKEEQTRQSLADDRAQTATRRAKLEEELAQPRKRREAAEAEARALDSLQRKREEDFHNLMATQNHKKVKIGGLGLENSPSLYADSPPGLSPSNTTSPATVHPQTPNVSSAENSDLKRKYEESTDSESAEGVSKKAKMDKDQEDSDGSFPAAKDNSGHQVPRFAPRPHRTWEEEEADLKAFLATEEGEAYKQAILEGDWERAVLINNHRPWNEPTNDTKVEIEAEMLDAACSEGSKPAETPAVNSDHQQGEPQTSNYSVFLRATNVDRPVGPGARELAPFLRVSDIPIEIPDLAPTTADSEPASGSLSFTHEIDNFDFSALEDPETSWISNYLSDDSGIDVTASALRAIVDNTAIANTIAAFETPSFADDSAIDIPVTVSAVAALSSEHHTEDEDSDMNDDELDDLFGPDDEPEATPNTALIPNETEALTETNPVDAAQARWDLAIKNCAPTEEIEELETAYYTALEDNWEL